MNTPLPREKTILVVEDNTDDVFFLRRILRKVGLEENVEFLSDGEEAIRHLEARLSAAGALPRLVLIDLNMPRVNGFELMTWIRMQPKLDQLMMVVMTSSPFEPDMQKANAAGVHRYLLKYPAPEELLRLAHAAKAVPEQVSHVSRP